MTLVTRYDRDMNPLKKAKIHTRYDAKSKALKAKGVWGSTHNREGRKVKVYVPEKGEAKGGKEHHEKFCER